MLRSSLRRWQAVFRQDPLFKIAVFLIPFENFFFAPSKGWAAIAPIAFFVYCVANLRRVPGSLARLRRPLLLVGAIVALTSLNYFASPPAPGLLLDTFRSLGLGLTFLVALDLHFEAHGRRPGPVLRVLVAAYCLSLLLGLIQLLVIQLRWIDLREVLVALSKRSTLRAGRIQFTFTEPAYTSMHVFGVLLPLVVLFARHRAVWRVRWVFAAFIAVALMSRPSLRFILDTFVVTGLWVLLVFAGRSKRNRLLTVGAVVAMAAGGVYFYQTSSRVRDIVDRGVYADGSLAARWFRVSASVEGWRKHPLRTLGGFGLSNAWVPFRAGYKKAFEDYRSDNLNGVHRLGARNPTSMLCMPVRMVSEIGLLASLAVVLLLFDRRRAFLFAVLLYVYLPFDSYAFYSLWLYLYFVKVRAPPGQGTASAVSSGSGSLE